MNIIITGAVGFIGSHIVEKLLFIGHKVYGVDNFDPFYDRRIKEKNMESFINNPNFRFYEIDINDFKSLKQIFFENRFDIVIHLAAKAGVRPSIEDPIGYYKTNVLGTLNVLEAMKEGGCKKMIFASSSSVYGNNEKIPFSEDDRVDNPISPYAASKKAGELLCHTYHHLYGFDIFCLRFFTVYGPRQRPDLAIHKFTKLIINGKPIPFYGDGSSERDYTYIDDIVDGVICAIDKLKGYEIFNIGESRTISLIKMVQTLEKVIGKKAVLNKIPFPKGDVKKTYADITKARSKLGYNPKYSFEEGIKEFIDWYLNINENTID